MSLEPDADPGKLTSTVLEKLGSLLGLGGLVLVVLFLVRVGQGVEIDWPTTVSVITNVATIAGIVVGALWARWTFQRQRVEAARMEISHAAQVWSPAPGRSVLRVGVTFKNIGQVDLSPQEAITRVQMPPTSAMESVSQPGEVWITELAKLNHPFLEDEVVLEPGEAETYYYDVEIPPGTTYLQIHTKVTRDGWEKKFWDETLLVPVEAGSLNGLAPTGGA